jgi:hypothetical protein
LQLPRSQSVTFGGCEGCYTPLVALHRNRCRFPGADSSREVLFPQHIDRNKSSNVALARAQLCHVQTESLNRPTGKVIQKFWTAIITPLLLSSLFLCVLVVYDRQMVHCYLVCNFERDRLYLRAILAWFDAHVPKDDSSRIFAMSYTGDRCRIIDVATSSNFCTEI